jgi:2-keto-3-deoxy-galactonokinase
MFLGQFTKTFSSKSVLLHPCVRGSGHVQHSRTPCEGVARWTDSHTKQIMQPHLTTNWSNSASPQGACLIGISKTHTL